MSQNYTRFSDEMLIRLDQKFTDHLNWAKETETNFDKRVKLMEAFVQKVDKPLEISFWIIGAILGAFLVSLGYAIWKLLHILAISFSA